MKFIFLATVSNESLINFSPSAVFYPLDTIHNWNNLYGKKGFFQYQFVLPEKVCEKGIREIFNLLIKNKSLSFLTVLKKFGDTTVAVAEVVVELVHHPLD